MVGKVRGGIGKVNEIEKEEDRCVNIFFFQAEDGIRDHCVTGVQTCALPILNRFIQCICFR